jgi:integrase
VFTTEDGRALSPQWVSVRFGSLAASLSKAAGQDTKIISELLGHQRTSFTDEVYIDVLPDVAKAAAEERAAVVPRRRRES